jgi:hypothetical protein
VDVIETGDQPMKRFCSACRATGAAILLLVVAGCSSHRTQVRNASACFVPRVDTTGWVRQAGPYHGFSYLLPPAFKEDTTGLFIHGGVMWRDGRREFHSANGYWGPRSFQRRHTENPDDPEQSECWTSIGGLRVLIATQYWQGQYAASAWFRDPRPTPGLRGYETVLAGQGISSQDQHLLLAILRTVRADSAR